MRIVAGIDEAGLGPLLGPLCLGFAAFEMPDGDKGLRHALRKACAKVPSKSEKRIVVCDSKVLHRGRNLAALERTALAFLAAANEGKPPRTIRDVLRFGLTSDSALDELPWYRDLDQPVPLAAATATRGIHCIITVCVIDEPVCTGFDAVSCPRGVDLPGRRQYVRRQPTGVPDKASLDRAAQKCRERL